MNDSRGDTVTRMNDHFSRSRGSVRTDLEIAAIVLTITGSTLTACALAMATLLASYAARTFCAARLGGLRKTRT
jgi:hypothetical protein